MSFGSSAPQSKTPSAILSLRVNQSTYGGALPWFRGTVRVPGNLLWYGDFTATSHTESAGGKGGGGVAGATTYTYSTSFVSALASGPVAGIRKVWLDKSSSTLAAQGLELHTGALLQPAWGHLVAHHPTEALGYSGMAYVAGASINLGPDPTLPNYTFELQGAGLASGQDDAECAVIVTDLLTDPVEGAAFPAARIADLSDYDTWCDAMGFRLSLLIATRTSARSALDEVLQASHAAPVWSQGKLKIVPYGDEPVGSWAPNVTPEYDITEDDILTDSAPLVVRRKRLSDAYNAVSIEYKDRANDYNTAIIERQDIAAIDLYGYRPKSAITLHSICDTAVAETIAATILNRELYIRNTYEFRLDWRFCLLEPMDIVTLTYPSLGLDHSPVRIIEIGEAEDGELSITAEEWPFGVATGARVPSQTNTGYTPNANASPGNANTPVVFEPPVSLAGNPEIWLGTSGGGLWGGCEVWISLDNATYTRIGEVTAPARHGLLTATLPNATDPDTANTLAVDLSVSRGNLYPATQAERDLWQSLLYVDGELIAYQNATLTAANRYNLTALRRGGYGSATALHAVGTKVMRLDDAVFRYQYDPALIGKTLYIKLRSYNTTRGGYQDLSDCTAHTYAVVGAPLGAVSGLALERPFVGLAAAWKWNPYPGASSYTVQLYSGTTLCRTVTGITATRYEISVDQALADGLTRSIELRVVAVSSTGQSTTASVIVSTNPQMAAPSLTTQAVPGGVVLSVPRPSAEDWPGGVRFWLSQDSGYTPASNTPAYNGTNIAQTFDGLAAGTWYVWAATYDAWGADSLNITTATSVTITALAEGVQRVANASAITAAPGSPPPGGNAFYAVYDNATGKMARWDTATGTYVFAVAASDIAGKLANAQINDALIGRIDLVDGPESLAGSVAARIAAEAALRGTAISNEATIRESETTSLAAQISTLTAGLAGGFDPGAMWYFTSGVEGWSASAATLSASNGWITLTSTSSDPMLVSPAISISGAEYNLVRLRLRRLAGSGWDGVCFYSTAGHTYDAAYRAGAAQPTELTSIGNIAVLEFDMSNLVSGGNDWLAHTITGIRLDLGNSSADVFEIDWIAIGRNAPGASMAGLLSEQTARIAADQAEATARLALAAQVNDATTGLPATRAVVLANQTAVATESAARAALESSINAKLSNAGGANLLPRLNAWTLNGAGAVRYPHVQAAHLKGGYFVNLQADGVSDFYSPYMAIKRQTIYTVSFWARRPGDDTADMYVEFYPDAMPEQLVTVAGGSFQRFVWTFLSPNTADCDSCVLRFRSVQQSGVDIWDVQLEEGAVATAWSPSPVEVDASIQSVATAVATETSARTTQYNSISARLNTGGDIKEAIVTTTAQAQATADAVAGTWGVTIDVDGKMSSLRSYNDGTTSSIVLDADEVLIPGSVTAGKMAADSINTTALQAGAVTADKASIAQLSALSANMGAITTGQITFAGGAGWSYARTDSKWLNDGVGGWVMAANPSAGEYFSEFRATSGSAIVQQRMAGGGTLGAQYYLQVRNAAGADLIVIDPANGIMKFKGQVQADSGYFAGDITSAATISGASGYFGTITSGYLQNTGNTASLNLNASGSTAYLRAGSKTLIYADGKTNFNNEYYGATIPTGNHNMIRSWVDDESNAHWEVSPLVDFEHDLGITLDVSEFYTSNFEVAVHGWWTSSSNTNFRVFARGEMFAVFPELGASWSGCRLKMRLYASIDVLNSHDFYGQNVELSGLLVKVLRIT